MQGACSYNKFTLNKLDYRVRFIELIGTIFTKDANKSGVNYNVFSFPSLRHFDPFLYLYGIDFWIVGLI